MWLRRNKMRRGVVVNRNSSPTPDPSQEGITIFPSWEGSGVGPSTGFKVRGGRTVTFNLLFIISMRVCLTKKQVAHNGKDTGHRVPTLKY